MSNLSSKLPAVLFAAGILVAQPPARVAPGFDSISSARLKADLTFLSSDALEGRRSLERGSEVAARWIASEFEKLGLATQLQPVPLIEYTMDRARTSLTIRHGGKSETFHGADAVANFPNEVRVSGPVVFAGYGITAPELN
ncbi:MAG TPA: hypothetical protein VH369_22520, partial [Bryobacteraceae bacterium]